MNCTHSDTTAILAVFGEAPANFEAHLSACEDCRSVVRSHLHTLAVLEPALEAEPTPATDAAHRFNPYASGFLLAAAVLLGIQFSSTHPPSTPQDLTDPIHTQATLTEDALDPIDAELAALEFEIAQFHLEES
jgi:hypothetical protein